MITKIKYTIEDFKNSTDEKLIELIYDKACEFHFGTFGETFDDSKIVIKELFATWVLESEVQNGGFDQFFENNGIEWGDIALNGLKRIDAIDFAILTEKAIEIYKNQDSEFESKRNPDFDDLDDEFYDLEGLDKFQIQYIRKNYEEFTVK